MSKVAAKILRLAVNNSHPSNVFLFLRCSSDSSFNSGSVGKSF